MFRRFVQKIEDISGPFLLAVSGGVDSMSLADMFLQAKKSEDIALAHCNFRLRSEESDGDEQLVRRWAAEHGVRIHVNAFDTMSYAESHGLSIEMAARELRYRWFAQLCREHGYRYVVVAHNANDNAETLILNIVRGSGMKGLSCMSEFSPCPYAGAEDVVVFRPLLEFTRKQIEGYAFANRLEYRNDSTNSSSEYRRNSIRNQVFPIFEKMNPSFVRTLGREIGYFTEAGEIVDQWCSSQMGNVLQQDGSRISLPRLMASDHWRYLLYHILSPYGFNSSTLASLENLLESGRTVPGKRFESPTHVVLTAHDSLIISSAAAAPVQTGQVLSQNDSVMAVRMPGTYHFNGSSFSVEVFRRDESLQLRQPREVVMLDADRLKFPFVCRRWRHGDWMVPLGMKGRKKVSDIFTDLKYDAFQKDSSIVVVDTVSEGMAENQHVSAVLGARTDNHYRIGPETRAILKITLL